MAMSTIIYISKYGKNRWTILQMLLRCNQPYQPLIMSPDISRILPISAKAKNVSYPVYSKYLSPYQSKHISPIWSSLVPDTWSILFHQVPSVARLMFCVDLPVSWTTSEASTTVCPFRDFMGTRRRSTLTTHISSSSMLSVSLSITFLPDFAAV